LRVDAGGLDAGAAERMMVCAAMVQCTEHRDTRSKHS